MEQGLENPYRAPRSDGETEAPVSAPGRLVQATRGSRLGASLIDTFIALAILGPVQYAAGVYDNFPNVTKQSPLQTVMWSAGGFVLFVALHGYLLKKNGQTIGKRALGIRIANVEDGSTPPLDRLLLWRVLPVQLVVLIPFVGVLASFVDALFIFRRDHRCVHDHIARTMVVRV